MPAATRRSSWRRPPTSTSSRGSRSSSPASATSDPIATRPARSRVGSAEHRDAGGTPVVALEPETREPKRSFFEVIVAVVIAAALVLGVYAIGHAVADDDAGGVSASDSAGTGAQAGGGRVDDARPRSTPTARPPRPTGPRPRSTIAGSRCSRTVSNTPTPSRRRSAPTDRAELARQLDARARSRAAVPDGCRTRKRAGLRRAGPFSPGLGAHYINYAGALGNADGTMSDDDIRASRWRGSTTARIPTRTSPASST